MQDCGGGAATPLCGMLITSAVAIFFSCSGATGFSEMKFDSEGLAQSLKLLSLNTLSSTQSGSTLTYEGSEGYVSSSFLGTELSIFTPLPERIVRKIL